MKVFDKHGKEIKDNERFFYKAIENEDPIEAEIITVDGERIITWEDGVEHVLDDFWCQWDSELSEKK